MRLDDKFDAEVMQAKWVLGGTNPEVLAEQAIAALRSGFSGMALQQLAGLVKPRRADLEDLPRRAFADMGLQPLNKEEAVSLLMARGIPPVHPAVAALLDAFSQFMSRWREHIAHWGGEPAGSYIDIAEFVHFVVEDLYEQGKHDEITRVFQVLESLLAGADDATTNLIALGFFETLQNFAGWRPYGNQVFEEYMGQQAKQIWQELRRIWAGKSSLAEVIRAENQK